MGIKGKLYGMVLLGVLMMPSLCFAADVPQVAAGDPPSTAIFDTVLMTIMHLCTGTGPQISGYAIGLFHHLIALDFVLAILFGLLAFDGAPNFIGLFANKMIKYGFWMWVIARWDWLVDKVASSLVQVGLLSGVTRDIMLHPSWVMDRGYTFAINFWDFCTESELASAGLLSLAVDKILLYLLGIIGVIFTFIAFFLIAVNVFLTTAEFYICSTLALIFVPFSVFDKTERFSSSAISLVISAGAKMMVFTLILGFMFKVLDSGEFRGLLTFKADAVQHAMFGVAMMFVMTYFCTTAPGLAASLVSGGGGGFGSGSADGFISQASTTGGIVAGAGTRGAKEAWNSGTKAAAKASQMAGGGLKGAIAGAVAGTAAGTLAGGYGVAKGAARGILQATAGGREEGVKSFGAASGGESFRNPFSKPKNNPKDSK